MCSLSITHQQNIPLQRHISDPAMMRKAPPSKPPASLGSKVPSQVHAWQMAQARNKPNLKLQKCVGFKETPDTYVFLIGYVNKGRKTTPVCQITAT